MRAIQKAAAPNCIAGGAGGLTWEQFSKTPCHQEVGHALRAEQLGLCCYCEDELYDGRCHIEHMVPKSSPGAPIFNYQYMASSCNGGTGDCRHCGHHKGSDFNVLNFVAPHGEGTSGLFRYTPDGRIDPQPGLSEADEEKANYMISLLDLRNSKLGRARAKHAKNVIKALGASPTAKTKQWADKIFLQPDSAGNLRSFYSLSAALLT